MLKFLLLINIHMELDKKEKVVEPEVSVEELQNKIDFLVKESIQHRTQLVENKSKIEDLEKKCNEKDQQIAHEKLGKEKILKISEFLIGICYAKWVEIPQEIQRELRIDLSNSNNYNYWLGGKYSIQNTLV